MAAEPRVIIDEMTFVESPRWHDDRLWFSDFFTNGVYSTTEDGGDLRLECQVPGQPSGLGWLPDGRLLVASMHDQTILRKEADGSLSVHADLSPVAASHLNDMVVDASGCAYVGDFGFDLFVGEPVAPANLFRVDPDGSVVLEAKDLWFPNGPIITEDHTLLVAETQGNRITAFDIAKDGGLRNRRSWLEFGPVPTALDLGSRMTQMVVGCDGCCLDADGAIWAADVVGSRAVHILPDGTIDQEIKPEDGAGVFACMLGGADGRTLFLCTCLLTDLDTEATTQARNGRLLAVEVAAGRAGRP
jgi:sugar lactone lactonase YvrE